LRARRPFRVRALLSARALRRHAAARRDRTCAELPAGRPVDGRAVRCARCADARENEPRAPVARDCVGVDRRARHALDPRGSVPCGPRRAAVAAAGPDSLDHRGRLPAAASARRRGRAALPGDRQDASQAARRGNVMPSREQLMKYLPWISTPVLIAVVLGLWNLAVSLGVSQYTLPPPGEVWSALLDLMRRPDVWTVHMRTTLVEAVAGFGIGLFSGVIVGAVLGRVVWLERAVRPMVVALQVIPKVALVPLFVIWFGFGMTSKVIIAAILAFFPIMLNVLLGVRSVDPGHRDVMRSLNAGRWQTFWALEFHSPLPYVFAGMEVGIVFAVIGAIVGEYLGGNEGL